jgi:hypothetical protein
MARTYKRDRLGRFASSGSGPNRATNVTGKAGGKSFKGEVGVRGKRIRDQFGKATLPESGSIWTKRKANATGLRGSAPKGTINDWRGKGKFNNRRLGR